MDEYEESEFPMVTCSRCDEEIDSSYSQKVGNEDWCDECVDQFAIECDACGELFGKDQRCRNCEYITNRAAFLAEEAAERKRLDSVHGPIMAAMKAGDERLARIRARYATDSDALLAACSAMFNLNRYAKHAECEQNVREVIYELKNKLIEVLHGMGLARRFVEHKSPRRDCFRCHGRGCANCDGGVFADPQELISISFEVVGRRFTWHQPAKSIKFDYSLTNDDDDSEWVPKTDKPLEVPGDELGNCALQVQWCIRKYGTSRRDE